MAGAAGRHPSSRWNGTRPVKVRFALMRTAGSFGGAKGRYPGGRLPRAVVRSAALCLLPCALLALSGSGPAVAEDLLRVTCRGQFRLSVTEPALECSESDMLTDAQGGLLSAFSAASAELASARLGAGAAGGAIRHVGYNGREASALMLQTFRIAGDWQGNLPLTVTLDLQYGFGGFGEARMKTALRSSLEGAIRREHLAGLHMRHTALGGALLADDNSRGAYSLPPPGRHPSRSRLSLSVVQQVPRERPGIVVRADLNALATPSLGSLDTTTSALVTVQAEIALSAPCPVSAHSLHGVLAVAESARKDGAREDGADWRCDRPMDGPLGPEDP